MAVALSRVVLLALLALSLLPATAGAALPPERSATDRLDDRRYVVTGPRAYVVGTQAGRYPAMGFHTRGEMGGVWAPPLKLLDGLWFAIDGQWIGPAARFTSGAGHARFDLPGRPGLTIERTDLVPDRRRGLLVGLRFRATGAAQTFTLAVDAHSELMSAYPWGETTPSQLAVNNRDVSWVEDGALLFAEGDRAAAVGARRGPGGARSRPRPPRPAGPGRALRPVRRGDARGAAALRRHRLRRAAPAGA